MSLRAFGLASPNNTVNTRTRVVAAPLSTSDRNWLASIPELFSPSVIKTIDSYEAGLARLSCCASA